MATLEQLSTALRNADAAGDVDAARALAAEIGRMRTAQPAAPQSSVSPEVNPASGGQKSFGLEDTWPARLVKSIFGAVTLPGDVMQGNVSIMGADGHTNPEVIERSADLAALASPVPAATRAGAGVFGVPMAAKAVPVTPTREALENAAKSGYEQARGLGLELRSQPIADMGAQIGASLNEKGIQGELAPKTFSILGKIASPPQDSVVTLQNLEALRRTFGHAARDFSNPTEQLAAKSAQRVLDDYLAAIPAQDVVRGPAAEASKILGEARANYAAAQRSGQVTGAAEAADLNAAAANSGQNLGNATRQRIKSLLLNEKKSAGYSPDELGQMESVVRGTATGNTTRAIGNLLGGGGGLGGAVSAAIGGVATAPYGGIGAVAPIVGMGLKKVSDASVNRQVRVLDEMIRGRSPLAKKLTDENLVMPTEVNPAAASIARLILMNEARR